MKKPRKKTGNNTVSPRLPTPTDSPRSLPYCGHWRFRRGLEAQETFFDHLPPAPGVALVIIQHLSPKHKSIMGQILQRHTSLPLREVSDGLEVAPNCVYFNSPDREVAIFNGKLHLMKTGPARWCGCPSITFSGPWRRTWGNGPIASSCPAPAAMEP
jgi:two-component system CheB/CheR fusion protein